jgi:predicted peroxiredoxin
LAIIQLAQGNNNDITIMIFTEGTVLKPRSLFALFDHKAYQPIGNCVSLINKWNQQGAEIVYCTSRRKKQAMEVAEILYKYHFAGTALYYRETGQTYKDLVEQVIPHILIEDDCRSIGGSWQMCITKVEPQVKAKIISIVVKEFKELTVNNLSNNCR